jgi:outer membrane protein assembly factor BamB
MNDDRIERALGSGPPDEPAYRRRGPAFWRAAKPTDPPARGFGSWATAWTRRLATLALCLIALLVAVQVLPATNGPAALPPGDFPMYKGGPGRTGEVGGPAPIAPVGTIWSVSIRGTTESSPAIADGVAYVVGGDHRTHALSMVDGEESWVSEGADYVGSPAYADGLVFVLGRDFSVSALDAADGAIRWRSGDSIYPLSSPLVLDGLVVAGTPDGLVAFDAVTGTTRWTLPTGGGIERSAAGADGIVVAGSDDGVIHVIDAATGLERWSRQVSTGAFATPVIWDGVLYATAPTAEGDTLFALDVSTGVQRWTFRSPSGLPFRTPSVDAATAYVGTVGGPTYAVSIATGTLRWTFDDAILSVAAIAIAGDDLIACTEDLRVIAIDRLTGSTQWSVATGGLVDAGTAVANGRIVVVTSTGDILALGTDP